MAEYAKPVPVVDHDSRPFWESVARHRMELPWCDDCEQFVFYPRALCPQCHQPVHEWRVVSGSGTIYSFTIARRPASPAFETDVPYAVALVDLDEGPRLMSNVLGDLDDIEIGRRVEIVYDDVTPDLTLYRFRLHDTPGSRHE